MKEIKSSKDFEAERDRITKTYGVGTLLASCYLANYVDGASCMRCKCKYLLYCDVIRRKESRRKKEEKKVDLTKKITVTLTEDDIKELVAEYVKNNANLKEVTTENVEMVYGVKYSGPQMDRVEHGYLIECRVKC